MNYLQPSNQSAIALLHQTKNQPFVMLNLIRLKKTADYTDTLLHNQETSNDAGFAFNEYVRLTEPFLKESGGQLLFYGDAGQYFVGPEAEQWDKILLIEQNSAENFFAFAQNPDYLTVLAHREASVEDSRLIPATRCK